ncbi:MAG: FecR family protein, partial [Halanaerobiales bacterium]
MKKILFIFMICCLVAIPFIRVYSESSNNNITIKITKVEGTVERKIEETFLGLVDKTEWKQLAEDDKIKPGDQIRVGDNGSLELYYENDIYIKVDSNSEFVIGESGEVEKKSQSIKLKLGRIWAKAKGAWGDLTKFEVKTPTVVAGVRGTLFSVEVDNKESILSVKEGIVEFKDSKTGNKKLVFQDEVSTARDGKIEKREMNNKEKQKWNQEKLNKWLENVRKRINNKPTNPGKSNKPENPADNKDTPAKDNASDEANDNASDEANDNASDEANDN